MSEATEQVTLDELLQLAIDARLVEVHTSMPAVVTSYDRTAGTVAVTIPINRMVPDGSGNYVSEPYPALADIPIEWPRCGKFSITFPLEANDTGMLILCQHNLGAWRTNGQAGDPGDIAMHTLDGAVFRPGLSPDSSPPSGPSATNMIMGSTTDAKGRIALKPGGGELGEGATKGIIREGDPCRLTVGGAQAVWMAQVEVFINGLVPGTLTPLVATFAATPGITAKTGSTTWDCED